MESDIFEHGWSEASVRPFGMAIHPKRTGSYRPIADILRDDADCLLLAESSRSADDCEFKKNCRKQARSALPV
jgi:hypothetical protein